MMLVVTFFLVLITLIGTIVGAVVIQQRRLLRAHSSFTGRLIAAQDRERAHIARELHDDLVQRLTTVTHALREQNGRVTDAQAHELDSIGESLRQVARALHPTAVDYQGLEPAMRTLVEIQEQASGVPIAVTFSGPLGALDGPRRLAIYRIAQESISNALRHAKATSIQLAVTASPELVQLTVRDDGRGFEFGPQQSARGLGLTAMEERTKLMRGRLDVTSAPGRGTQVTVELPIPAAMP
jgi:signal transduction histidine kinase